MVNLRKKLKVKVTQEHIDKAVCGDPNKCMIKYATVDAVGKNCYCKVDAAGIYITRRNDYRERAFVPRKALRELRKFDNGKHLVKPFEFNIEFVKSTKIYVANPNQIKTTKAKRDRLKAAGLREKNYGKSSRTNNVAFANAVA